MLPKGRRFLILSLSLSPFFFFLFSFLNGRRIFRLSENRVIESSRRETNTFTSLYKHEEQNYVRLFPVTICRSSAANNVMVKRSRWRRRGPPEVVLKLNVVSRIVETSTSFKFLKFRATVPEDSNILLRCRGLLPADHEAAEAPVD